MAPHRASSKRHPPAEGPVVRCGAAQIPTISPADRCHDQYLREAATQMGSPPANSPLRPVLGNPNFEPGLRDGRFRALRESGVCQVSHFSIAGRWRTPAELMDQGGGFQLDFMRANQLNHFLHTMIPPHTGNLPLTPIEEICSETGTLPHALSILHNILVAPQEGYQLPCITKWEQELHCTFSAKMRQQILTFTHKSSICTKIQETNYKILTRWYRTPVQLHKLFRSTSEACWRC